MGELSFAFDKRTGEELHQPVGVTWTRADVQKDLLAGICAHFRGDSLILWSLIKSAAMHVVVMIWVIKSEASGN